MCIRSCLALCFPRLLCLSLSFSPSAFPPLPSFPSSFFSCLHYSLVPNVALRHAILRKLHARIEKYHGFASHVSPIHVRNTWFVLGVTIGNLHSNAFGIFFTSTFFCVFVIEVLEHSQFFAASTDPTVHVWDLSLRRSWCVLHKNNQISYLGLGRTWRIS